MREFDDIMFKVEDRLAREREKSMPKFSELLKLEKEGKAERVRLVDAYGEPSKNLLMFSIKNDNWYDYLVQPKDKLHDEKDKYLVYEIDKDFDVSRCRK